MEEELRLVKFGEFKNDNDVIVDDHGGEDPADLKETRVVGRDSGSHSSSSSSSDSDEETRDLLVHEKSDEIVVNQEKLVWKEDEGVVVEVEPLVVDEVEPLVVDAIRETETLFNGLETNETKEQNSSPLDESTGASPNVIENGLVDGAGLIDSVPEEKLTESSDVVELVPDENVNTGLQVDEHSKDSSVDSDLNSGENVEALVGKSVDLPSVVADKSDEHGVEVEIPENRIYQPIISPSPRAWHMTSWRSCCGLFDVLSSPDR